MMSASSLATAAWTAYHLRNGLFRVHGRPWRGPNCTNFFLAFQVTSRTRLPQNQAVWHISSRCSCYSVMLHKGCGTPDQMLICYSYSEHREVATALQVDSLPAHMSKKQVLTTQRSPSPLPFILNLKSLRTYHDHLLLTTYCKVTLDLKLLGLTAPCMCLQVLQGHVL